MQVSKFCKQQNKLNHIEHRTQRLTHSFRIFLILLKLVMEETEDAHCYTDERIATQRRCHEKCRSWYKKSFATRSNSYLCVSAPLRFI